MKRLVLLFLVILFSGNSFAQDTTAVDKKAVPAPIRIKTEKEEIEEFKKSLPTIDMKEHVITGKEEMKVEPSEKKLDEDPEFVKGKKEILDESGDPIPKKPFEYSDVKHTKAIYLPSAGEGNFLQLLYGRYSEMDAVLQTGKVYNNDEVIFGGDFRRTSGFTDNADMYNGSLWFSDFHRFTEGVTGVVNFAYAQGMHKFYGSSVFPDLERTTQFFNGGFQLHSRRWTSWDIGLEAGGRAGKVKDMEDVTETGVNGRFYVKKIAGSALVKAEILYDGEFLDRDSENHTVDLVKGNFEIEGNIKRVFRIKVGLNMFNVTDTDNNSFSRAYPYARVGQSFPGLGELYGEFAPEVTVTNMRTALTSNRYMSAHSLFSYTDYPLSVKIGWQNKKIHDFSWEVYYLFQKIDHFGIETEQSSSGMWGLNYSYDTELQGVRFLMNWQQSDVLTLWASASVMDYGDLELIRIGDGELPNLLGGVPYHSNVSGDLTLDITPGGGMRFELTGKYAGSRYISAEIDDKLDPYLLVDLALSKRFHKRFGVAVKIFNLFNQEFESRRNYRQPDMVSTAGINYYW